MHYIGYIAYRIAIFSLKITPFPILYLNSSILSFIIYHIVGYRKKVVFKNLRNSFPEKSEEEIKQIAKKFYIHLTDIILETLKGTSSSPKKILKRFTVENPEVYDEFCNNNINTISVGGHYGNWEWGAQTTNYLLKAEQRILYKPLSNKYIDKHFKKTRTKFGVEVVPINFTRRAFTSTTPRPFNVVMIADQNPSNISTAYWINFLNQDTACLEGAEKYARLFNYPVIFFNTRRVKRGHYSIRVELITRTPKALAEKELTQKYMELLEREIREHPEYYLWSHNRWKHTKTS